MPRIAPLFTLMLCGASLAAQSRVNVGLDAGIAIPMGDLGLTAATGRFGSISARASKPTSRSTFGVEIQYQRMQFDSVTWYPELCCDVEPPLRFQGERWQSYGVMARIEYTITRGLYAIGGAGMLFRSRTPDAEHPVAQKAETTDAAAQAGFGYRLGRHIALEARFINVFTVNASERMFPFTAGIRF